MKKTLLFLIIALLSTQTLCAQKKGFQEIQINTTLAAIKSLHKYKITLATTDKNTYIVKGDSLRMFLMDIDYLQVTVNNKDTIKSIIMCTKAAMFEDYKDWLSSLGYVLNVVNGDVGKLNSDDLSRPSSNELTIAWSFVNTKTALILDVDKVYSFATKFKANYVFSWVEDPHNFADKKF